MDQVGHRGCQRYGSLLQPASNLWATAPNGLHTLPVMREHSVLLTHRGMGSSCLDTPIVLIKHQHGNSTKLLLQSTTDTDLVVGDAIQAGGIATIYKNLTP